MASSTDTALPAYKTVFFQSCLSSNVLTFGSFTLKSGRQSPYFFNAGLFHTAPLHSAISTALAHTIISFLADNPTIPKPDVIFGPAYKGISLASSALLELYRLDSQTFSTVSYSFNRKEVKDHGEGGSIVGASLTGKNVLVVDDVVTAGTAMRESLKLVNEQGGKVVAFIVALDRQERIPGAREKAEGILDDATDPKTSTLGQIRNEFGIPSTSIINFDDLIAVLRQKGDENDLKRLEEYKAKYQAID